MKDYFDSIRMMACYSAAGRGAPRPQLRDWAWALGDCALDLRRFVVCAVRGHRLVEELVSAEDGLSALHCTRCGWSHGPYRMG
jgi:hypothetical protein